ncbi:transmembrane and TPR repeat-containing protein 4 [Phthorimaea operculella]|nr:transmembrane and TPR repeat-containing protein 4 [Phthorimaea operculella]
MKLNNFPHGRELNRLRRAAISLGFSELLTCVGSALERECQSLPSTAPPECALQLAHAAAALRDPRTALDIKHTLQPLAANFTMTSILNGNFVFDDSEAIIDNLDVYRRSWTSPFTNDFWGTPINASHSHKSYRPLTILSFRFNYYLNGQSLSSYQFKVTNLIFHITCSFILWKAFDYIIRDIEGKKRRKWYNDRAFLATLLFAVHPIHTEAVCGIVGRADVLAGNTFFLAFILYRKAMFPSEWSYHYLFGAIAMAAASMLFKENGITVLGFCIIYELLKKFNVRDTPRRRNKKMQLFLDMKSVMRIIATTVAILLCLYCRWSVMGGTKPKFQAVDNPAAFSNNLFTKIATYNYIYFLNLLLLVWPQWLCFDWSMGCVPVIKDLFDYRLIFVVLMYMYGTLVFKAIFNSKNRESTKRVTVISLLLLVIPFLPAMNIFFPVGFVIAERILYIPSAGYCLFITIAIRKFNRLESRQKYKVTPAFFCLLLFLLGLRSWERADDWRTEYQLFLDGNNVCPNNAKVHYNIAKSVDPIDKEWAKEEYEEAIRLHPKYYQAMNNLANLLKIEKRYKEAELLFKKALKIQKDFPAAWMNLGTLFIQVERYKEAEAALTNALRHKSNYPECFYNLGNVFLLMNNTEKAIQSWMMAIRQNYRFEMAWHNLLQALIQIDDHERGIDISEKALEAFPNSPKFHFSAASLYGSADNFTLAEKHFKIAIQLFGSEVKALHYGNFGVLYHRWRKLPLAMEMYQKALEIDPHYEISFSSPISYKPSAQKVA